MPRFTLHRPADHAIQTAVPEEMRLDTRVKLIGELPRMLLFESSADVAGEWAAKLKGWRLASEQCARLPDPRPKLKHRLQ